MPPRYAYWTILVDDQPTAFRSGAKEDLLPTFNRLKEKSPSAVMMWFQNGKLWPSRLDAQEAMRARGEMGRRGDERQVGFRSRDRESKPRTQYSRPKTQDSRPSTGERPEWKPKSEASTFAKATVDKPSSKSAEKLDWKPKGEFTPAPKRSERPDWKPKGSFDRDRKPEWKSKASTYAKATDSRPRTSRSEKPEWKPKGSFDRDRKPDWKPKGSFDRDRKPEWKPRTQDSRPRTSRPPDRRSSESSKLEWTPKSQAPGPKSPEKRKWVPKEEYKKSLGIEAKRDGKWRPGGEHRDPRQKYKDAKKAKWTKFKTTIRTKWESKKKKG